MATEHEIQALTDRCVCCVVQYDRARPMDVAEAAMAAEAAAIAASVAAFGSDADAISAQIIGRTGDELLVRYGHVTGWRLFKLFMAAYDSARREHARPNADIRTHPQPQ